MRVHGVWLAALLLIILSQAGCGGYTKVQADIARKRAATRAAIAAYERGADAARLQNYGEAVDELESAIVACPEYYSAHLLLSWINATCPVEQFVDGNAAVAGAAEALRLFDEAHVAAEDRARFRWLFLACLAAAHARSGAFDNAVKFQTRAIDAAKGDPEAGDAGLLKQCACLALYDARRALQTTATSPARIDLDWAQQILESHSFSDPQRSREVETVKAKLTLAREKAAGRREAVQAAYDRGAEYARHGRYAEAIEQFELSIRLRPKFFPAHMFLGWILATCPEQRWRNGVEAVNLASEAIRLFHEAYPDPADRARNDWALLTCLAAAHAESRDFDSAVRLQTEAIQADAEKLERTDLILQTCLALYESGTPLETTATSPAELSLNWAQQALESLPASDPQFSQKIETLKARIELARKEAEKRLDASNAAFDRGAELARQGKYREAIEQFHLALREREDNYPAHSLLAWIHATCPDEACLDGRAALRHAAEALRLFDDSEPTPADRAEIGWMFPAYLAAAHARLGDFDKAVELQTQAIEAAKLNPDDQEGVLLRLRACLTLYQSRQALETTATGPRRIDLDWARQILDSHSAAAPSRP